ncbi:MAG: hypothetical protein Q8J63_00740 [Candidatus Aquicultor sp.]|nr:hypothetical protein [Candidatus Aquicultor sp.]
MKRHNGIIKLRDYLLWRSDATTTARLEELLEETYQARSRGLFEPETDPNEPSPRLGELTVTIHADFGNLIDSLSATQAYLERLMKSRPVGALAAYREGED